MCQKFSAEKTALLPKCSSWLGAIMSQISSFPFLKKVFKMTHSAIYCISLKRLELSSLGSKTGFFAAIFEFSPFVLTKHFAAIFLGFFSLLPLIWFQEVCSQIWATLYDYPCLKSCDGIIKYVNECVRVAWGLVNQVRSSTHHQMKSTSFINALNYSLHFAGASLRHWVRSPTISPRFTRQISQLWSWEWRHQNVPVASLAWRPRWALCSKRSGHYLINQLIKYLIDELVNYLCNDWLISSLSMY